MHKPKEFLMPELVIEPFKSVGLLNFGMTRTDILRVMGPPDRESEPYLWYAELGLKVELRRGHCVFVESALHRVVLTVRGIRLEGTIRDLVSEFSELGVRPTFGSGANVGAVDFVDLGISLWCEADELADIDTAAAWALGYWET